MGSKTGCGPQWGRAVLPVSKRDVLRIHPKLQDTACTSARHLGQSLSVVCGPAGRKFTLQYSRIIPSRTDETLRSETFNSTEAAFSEIKASVFGLLCSGSDLTYRVRVCEWLIYYNSGSTVLVWCGVGLRPIPRRVGSDSVLGVPVWAVVVFMKANRTCAQSGKTQEPFTRLLLCLFIHLHLFIFIEANPLCVLYTPCSLPFLGFIIS